MEFLFDAAATVEAASYLLKRAGGRLNYTVLLKMLYLADRASLIKWHCQITGAHPCNMDNGPVLSECYNLIREQPYTPGLELWKEHISLKQYDVELRSYADFGELSRASRHILDETYEKFGKYTWQEIIDYCHKELPEWKDPHGGRVWLHLADILSGAHVPPQEAATAMADIEYYNAAKTQLAM